MLVSCAGIMVREVIEVLDFARCVADFLFLQHIGNAPATLTRLVPMTVRIQIGHPHAIY